MSPLKSNRHRLNILTSFAFIAKGKGESNTIVDLLLGIAPYVNILIDSGAFSNFTIRRKQAVGQAQSVPLVQLDDYINFCKTKLHGNVWQYIALDVIRNRTETDRNLQAMLDAGLKPMPVYIEGYGPDDLNRILEINERICVAGGVGSADGFIMKRYRDVFAASGGRAKIHGLGYGRWPNIFHIPVASSDSSAYNTGGRFGNISIYDRANGFQNISWQHLSRHSTKLSTADKQFYIEYLHHNCHIPYTVINDASYYSGSHASIPSLVMEYSYLQFMQHVNESGRDYFLAAPNTEWVASPIVCLKFENPTCDGFDYLEARNYILHMREVYQRSKTEYVQRYIDILKEKTNWTPRPHSA